MSTEPRRIKRLIHKLPRDPLAGKRPVLSVSKDEVEAEPRKGVRVDRQGHAYVYMHSKPRVVDGYITLSQLAEERGIQPQLARIWVKKAAIAAPAVGWRWKGGSRELKRVRKALGLSP